MEKLMSGQIINFVFTHNMNVINSCEIVTGTSYGEVEGLPAPSNGTIYIVSSLVAARCVGRTDVFIPNESVRDEQGRIVGCRSLGRV